MLVTTDHEKRRDLRKKIRENLSEIVTLIDNLDRTAAELKNHLHLHDRFFFQHSRNIDADEAYGSPEELLDLWLDTNQMISRLRRASASLDTAGALAHFYDYETNPVFGEFARTEAKGR